jgi:hypothetical protein
MATVVPDTELSTCLAGTAPPLAGRRALFVSWVSHHGRSEDLAAALGAECAFVAVGTLRNRRTAVLRHLWQSLATLLLLARRRPRVLLVMAPPPALVLLALAWGRVTGGKVVVDCHSKAVLGNPLSARLAARGDLVLVTLPQLAGGFARAVAVHDPPVTIAPARLHDEVVFPASWYVDEPVGALLDAARSLPEVRFAVTGTPPAGLDVPANVRLTGFLSRADYLDLLAGAALVLALTTREDTMQRAAYEAVGAGRPIVASDTRALRSYLGDAAVYTDDTGAGISAAVSSARARGPELAAATAKVRHDQQGAFCAAIETIGRALA